VIEAQADDPGWLGKEQGRAFRDASGGITILLDTFRKRSPINVDRSLEVLTDFIPLGLVLT
jgi:hypothetical protein